jgi:hypothetical protein
VSSIDQLQYIKVVTATPEKDEKGRKYIIAKVTNDFIKEIKTAEEKYIEFKQANYNAQDSIDKKEMAISQEIRQEIHEVWKLLNQS